MIQRMFITLEWRQMLRSKWLLLVALLFAVVFVAIVMIQQMALPDVEGFTRQTASFLNLLLFLLPLFALTIGSMSIAGDIESGWFSLLKTYPLTLSQYIIGKFIALCGAFFFIIAFAFGVVLLLGGVLGGVRLPLAFVVLALCLIVISSALSIFIGSVAKNRLYALAISLVVWALLLLLLSYMLMAVGTIVAGHVLQKLTIVMMHINPVEWLRFAYFVLADQATVLGPTYYDIIAFYESGLGMVVFTVVTIAWVVVPLMASIYVLRKNGVKK
ncbi:ABC transporter permease subunit [Lysinibacillus sp. LZ02]|uniref:ABC transporter permease subunit n=1 Tax=Lysinibacillus sp. LZ02 TaxID=3420668 RepID=UPI003D3604A3